VDPHHDGSPVAAVLSGDSDVTVILGQSQKWTCPNCPAYAVTFHAANRFHNCPGVGGIMAPMVLAGTDCRVYAVEREEYVGDSIVHYDNTGRPIMSVVTERPDGSTDCIAFADTAQMDGMV
jgi:hypothetical protein